MRIWIYVIAITIGCLILSSHTTFATTTVRIVPTTLTISICGNSVVDDGEQCDVPGETGVYSETIAGRQCTPVCQFGPYCGDGILQSIFGEECDDGNNDDGDFCSSECTIEPAGSGGGGSSGGGTGRSGGGSEDFGETQINIVGRGYPNRRVNILLDTETVGGVQTDGDGNFEFSTEASPGAASLGFWSTDTNGNRSVTLNTTFDVTQGAITNINGVIIPPTLLISDQTIDPGDEVTFSGQSVPNADIEIHFNDSEIVLDAVSGGNGDWALAYNTTGIAPSEYTVRARSITGRSPLTTESSFSTSQQLFVGVDGSPTTPSDLNRDGLVNLTDFSILIFWWQSAGGDSDPPADINGNGNVGLEDFSIMLFNWTG